MIGLELIKSTYDGCLRFDEISWPASYRTLDRRTWSHDNYTKGSSFCSVELSLHTTGITGGLWELTKIIFRSIILIGMSWNYFIPSKGVSMILWWRSRYVPLPDRIESEASHIKGAHPDQ